LNHPYSVWQDNSSHFLLVEGYHSIINIANLISLVRRELQAKPSRLPIGTTHHTEAHDSCML